jgi:NAD(P)H dehydrogenase (quinone)
MLFVQNSKQVMVPAMAKIVVLYDSHSGNTAKMAALVAEGALKIPQTEVRVRSIDDPSAKEDILWCDGIAVGSPTNMGLLSWKMKRFWDETMFDSWMKLDGKVGCAFSSEGGSSGGAEITCQSLCTVLINFGILVFGVTDYVSKTATCHYGAAVLREPRGEEAKDVCRILGKRLAEWSAIMADGRKDQHPDAKPEVRLKPS